MADTNTTTAASGAASQPFAWASDGGSITFDEHTAKQRGYRPLVFADDLPAAPAAQEAEPAPVLCWVHEDELPESMSQAAYSALFPYSKVDVVRMFPIFAPPAPRPQADVGAVPVKYVPVDSNLRDGRGRHPNDDEPRTEACDAALDARGDDKGQGLDPYWKWAFAAGFNAALAAAPQAPAAPTAAAEEPAKADPRKIQLQGMVLALARLACVPPVSAALEHQVGRLADFYFANGEDEFARKLVLLKRGALHEGRLSVLHPSAAAPAPAAGAAPTDAEIEAFREAFDWEGYTDQRVAQRAFGRAVLARWGAAAPAQEAEDAARYRYLRSRMEFQSQKGCNPTMGLGVRIVAQHHDPHTDWMEPRFSASVDRAIDAARARQEGGA